MKNSEALYKILEKLNKNKVPTFRETEAALKAYADCNGLEDAGVERNLDFTNFLLPLKANALKALCKECCPNGYNSFDSTAVEKITKVFGKDANYFFGRESSPCIYVKPNETSRRTWIEDLSNLTEIADEVSFEHTLGMFRIWFD